MTTSGTKSEVCCFIFTGLMTSSDVRTSQNLLKSECNPVLTVDALFCYHQIGHKEQAEKSVAKRKISA